MMKKLMMLIVVGILSATSMLVAETENVNGYTWTYRVSGDSAVLVGVYPGPTETIVIPSTLGVKPVTSIGDGAFYGQCFKAVLIPNSVITIGNQSFFECSELESVAIGNNVTDIGQQAFEGCRNLKNVKIGYGVTSIGLRAFDSCSSMVSYDVDDGNTAYKSAAGLLLSKDGRTLIWGVNGDVMVPDGVQRIDDWAFRALTNLTSITIPASVTSIDSAAFQRCNNLMSFVVADGNPTYKSEAGLLLKKDGHTIIHGVNGDVTIPNCVTKINDGAFSFCGGLRHVTIPASVTNVGIGAFAYCNNLAPFEVSDENPSYRSEFGLLLTKDGSTLVSVPGSLANVAIPNHVTGIGVAAFRGCGGLTDITIPNSVTNIGEEAFYRCENLKSVTIPDSIIYINDQVFGECFRLASVALPKGVISIGYRAFYECGLTGVTIPDSVVDIGAQAFYYNNGLLNVTIGNSVASIGASAFSMCPYLKSVIFKGNAPTVGNSAFSYVGSGCTVYVRNGTTGWDVTIPGKWNRLTIRYLTTEVEIAVANEVGGGTVEVDGELSSVEVASGVTLVVNGVNLDADALAAKIVPKPHEDGQSAELFKVKSESVEGGVSLAVVLDEEAVDPDATAAEIVDDATMAAFAAVGEGATVSVPLSSAKPGLYYGIAAASDLSQLEAAAANAPLVQADDGGVTVPVAKPAGSSAFFKVIVSDRAR